MDEQIKKKNLKILNKFKKPSKQYQFMLATTQALEASVNDFSPIAYFASISAMIERRDPSNKRTPDLEVLAYCFSVVLSMMDVGVIQNQHSQIFAVITKHLLVADSSAYTCKYGLIALQFLLHSKTASQWQMNACLETKQATELLLSSIVDTKREKAQKQAVKSLCIILQNKSVNKMTTLKICLQNLTQEVFFNTREESLLMNNSGKQSALLYFLSAGVQVMPEESCCDTATNLIRFVDATVNATVKTQVYLTLEVLYASRRLSAFGDHIQTILRHLLENPELPDFEDVDMDMKEGAINNLNKASDQRVVAFIQATSQICLNFASQETIDDFLKKQILRYITLSLSVFCEYLASPNYRIRRASFSAMRLLISYGLTKKLLVEDGTTKKDDDLTDILNLDALTISEEVKSMRKDNLTSNKMSVNDKLLIHICYLLTSRFEEVQDLVLRIVCAFIAKVGSALKQKQIGDFLLVISQLKVRGHVYETWMETMGTFMCSMGCAAFFKVLPLRIQEFDLNSLTFAQDSRSYLLQVCKQFLKKEDLVFFLSSFVPMINSLDSSRETAAKPGHQDYSMVKAKKYETLQVQIWELMPIFCRFNSARYSEAVATIIGYLEPMVNKNILGLRITALKTFSEIISHCKNTKVVTDQIKKTRLGLQRISFDYINGLSQLYCTVDADAIVTNQDKTQILETLRDFASIAKSVKLSNLFLTEFSSLVSEVESHAIQSNLVLLKLDVLISLMEQIKLKKENYVALMRGVKIFVEQKTTEKKGYKMLAKVIEKFQAESIQELIEIKDEVTPIMKGQPTKQRLTLIKAFVSSVAVFKSDSNEQNLPSILTLVKSMIIELITSLGNSNLKIRKLSEEVFNQLSVLLASLKAQSQLLQLLLVGLAGTSASVQSSTIRALIFNLKQNVDWKFVKLNPENQTAEENLVTKLQSRDPQVQDFLRKVTRVIALFLKDPTAPKELQRSVLKFLKVVITFLDFEKDQSMVEVILTHVFAMKNSSKYTMILRRILNKLIVRVGVKKVLMSTNRQNQKLIHYVERERRKVQNARQRNRLHALLGREPTAAVAAKAAAEKDSDEDMSDGFQSGDEVEQEQEPLMRAEDEELDSSDSDDDLEEQHTDKKDQLQAPNKFDIPETSNIPIISQLVKEVSKEDAQAKQKKEKKDKINKIIEGDKEELETHFVDNPFIRIREKANRKGALQNLRADDLEDDNTANQDVILLKEENKFVIKDFEQMDADKAKEKLIKRKRQEVFGYGKNEDMSDDSEDEGKNVNSLRQKVKDSRFQAKKAAENPFSQSGMPTMKKRDIKKFGAAPNAAQRGAHSSNVYASKKGKGDVLKAGKHEPYAYIKLNPEMLNPRKKSQAVNSFSHVVSHGKKTDKRTGKKQTGLLSGMSVKSKKE